jgi:hypothetical protein
VIRRFLTTLADLLGWVGAILLLWALLLSPMLLVSCRTRDPVGTVQQVNVAPPNYVLVVISRYVNNTAYETKLVDVGTETGCTVGDVWPGCDASTPG